MFSLNKIHYVFGFAVLVVLLVVAFITPIDSGTHVALLRTYTVAGLCGVVVGCAWGEKKRLEKCRKEERKCKPLSEGKVRNITRTREN